jgi:small-conductance mechanosensitive channel
MNTTDREKRAAIFESLLLEHDKLSREVSLIQSKFDLTNEDNKKINELKRQMEEIQRKAFNLGSY